MYTFTGSSKKARNVNLSGRAVTSNPFAKNSNPFATPSSQSAVATAQQDRLARQRERERTQAASKIQKAWRAYSQRSKRKTLLRKQWDEVEKEADGGDVAMTAAEEGRTPAVAYRSQDEAQRQLDALLEFVDPSREDDLERLERYFERADATLKEVKAEEHGDLAADLLLLERRCLNTLEHEVTRNQRQKTPRRMSIQQLRDRILPVVLGVIGYLGPLSAHTASLYYRTLAVLAIKDGLPHYPVLVPSIQAAGSRSASAYEALVEHFFLLPNLSEVLPQEGTESFSRLLSSLDPVLLGLAVTDLFRKTSFANSWFTSDKNVSSRLGLLTCFIYCYRLHYGSDKRKTYASEHDFVLVVGRLLSSLADFVHVESTALADNEDDAEQDGRLQLNNFQREQIYSLIDQESVAGVVAQIGSLASGSATADETTVVATYILTLLRMFPRRGDEIRMWLYLGPVKDQQIASTRKLDVISYFWHTASSTKVYHAISQDPRAAIDYLKPRSTQLDTSHLQNGSRSMADGQRAIDEQWRDILIFIELYMFVLKVMDDEEFFSNNAQSSIYGNTTSKNALSLDDLQRLSTFLKHLAFTMYYYTLDLADETYDTNPNDFSRLFHPNDVGTGASPTPNTLPSSNLKRPPVYIAGIQGLTLDYVKGLTTGLVRAIYERDSRRPFMPTNHWLMTSRFDMTNFIDAVVDEEERRSKVQQEDDEDESDSEDPIAPVHRSRHPIIGTSQAQRHRRIEQLQRQQRKASRQRYLQAVAPRLEILQNMPFIIPFTTRVKIFRRFIAIDQAKVRGGLDPDVFNFINPQSGRHQAKIRREHEFEDAYDQFYELGAALKQPISITFVDKFDQQEAGIDGGGVTKEFLTTVTGQAFKPDSGEITMFSENDQHLLYPNPTALDEQREILREAGIQEGSEFWRGAMQDLLQKYEFLGRIIGKCLYENILVDVGFAGFFLLKWALTGGAGQAPKESGYRANLNDLRDFDDALYQGLVSTSFSFIR